MSLPAFTFAVPAASRRSSFLPRGTLGAFARPAPFAVRRSGRARATPRAVIISPIPQKKTGGDDGVPGAASSNGIPPKLPPAGTSQVAVLASPAGVFDAAVDLGTQKANKTALAIILMGMAAGAYIAVGCLMSLCVGGVAPAMHEANPGLAKFLFGFIGQPVGLFFVLTTGAELFTGNSMLMTISALRARAKWPVVIAKWLLVFVANCIGALLVCGLALKSQIIGPIAADFVSKLAVAKTAVPFEVAFMRGVGCNWIVCMGVLAAAGARDLLGKFACAMAVVSMFVSLGFDQCIANMFFLPMGMFVGADLSWKTIMMANILPVTLGNIVGGALLVGMVYHIVNPLKKAAK